MRFTIASLEELNDAALGRAWHALMTEMKRRGVDTYRALLAAQLAEVDWEIAAKDPAKFEQRVECDPDLRTQPELSRTANVVPLPTRSGP